jgi:phosphatidate cytidylyltransferase
MSRNLLVRVAFAVPAIGVVVVVLWRGGILLAALLAVLGVLGTREIYDFARRQGIAPLEMLGYLAAAAIPFAAIWVTETDFSWVGPVLALGALWMLAVLVTSVVTRSPQQRPLSAVAVTVFGCLYASALLTFIVPIRHGTHSEAHPLASTALVVFPLAITWIGDTCAMAVGTLVGGRKLAPVLSPNKTWSGAVGGVAGALVAAFAFGPTILDRLALHLNMAQLLIFGMAIAVVAQLGDVAESLFKREVGLKDSSALIPGHGGVLDRLDSLYFVVPVSACLFWLFGLI